MKLTGAQALIKSLEMQEVEVMFGLPGGAILPVYDPIIDSPIRHILVRHEQGAGHMAEGYAQVTGRPGVAMVTSGPAATNIVTPLCNAYMDSTPIVVITGQVASTAIGTDAFRELVDMTGIPVVTTLMARGSFPDSHPLCLGMPGMHGNYTAVTSMQKCDLLIALGSRFDDRVTGKVSAFAPDAKVIHVDIDPAELNKVRRPDVPIVGDCRLVDEEMNKAIRDLGGTDVQPDRTARIDQIRAWQKQYPLHYEQPETGNTLKPQYVLERLRDNAPEDTILVAGVGQHQMWSSQYWRFEEPYTWVNSGGLGTMGFAVPAAVGAKVGQPGRTVWAVDGDGCFQMTAQELVTAATERIPIKVAILNNAYLGMVRQWQELFYEERYSEVYLSPDLPDYKLWAESMGCVGLRVESPEEVEPAIDKANDIDDRPVVIDFRTDSTEKVYPMVPAGGANDDIILDPSQGEGGR